MYELEVLTVCTSRRH